LIDNKFYGIISKNLKAGGNYDEEV
jgi:hypothetical protein